MQSIGSNERKMFEPGHLPIPKHRKLFLLKRERGLERLLGS